MKLLEDELAEGLAGALKKQHDKLTILIGEATELRGPAEEGVGVEAFEAKRKECMDARWEMIIHRTACGFKAGVYDAHVGEELMADAIASDDESEDEM